MDHTKFGNNTVINSNCAKGGAIYSSKSDGSDNFQIIDCKFRNCRGDDGGTIYFVSLDHDFLIQNTVFEHCKNYYNSDLSDMISMGATKDLKLTVNNCNFSFLECDSQKKWWNWITFVCQ